MSPLVWALLGFAAWTLLVLVATVGVYRWSRILTRRQAIGSFRADVVEGTDFYKRAMRAHANCVENLPVFAAIVGAALVSGAEGPTLDVLAATVLGARIGYTLVHVGFEQTDRVAALRFALFAVQLLAMLAMIALIARHALGHG